jgi:outer membrane protein assembly factor BamD
MKVLVRSLVLLLLVMSVTSCSKFRRIQKSPDWRLKYDAALEYYKKEKYYKSSTLLDEILPIIRGTKEAEAGNYYLAYAYFHQKQYILSAHHFKEFYRIYGRSEWAQEAEYMHAYCTYLQSPDYNLDQKVSIEAINALQNYIDRYPRTERLSDAEKYISELQVKLETKAYNNAKLYYKLRRYKAAMVVYENFHKDFPDSEYREEVSFLSIGTAYEYARVSILSKQEERFKQALELYENFIDKYPNSKFLKAAEVYYIKSRDELVKMQAKNAKKNA